MKELEWKLRKEGSKEVTGINPNEKVGDQGITGPGRGGGVVVMELSGWPFELEKEEVGFRDWASATGLTFGGDRSGLCSESCSMVAGIVEAEGIVGTHGAEHCPGVMWKGARPEKTSQGAHI